MACSLLLIALLGVAPVGAHPFDSSWFGQQLDVRLQAEQIEVRYRVEVPSRVAVGWLAKEARAAPDVDLAVLEAQVIERELRDLEDGLVLEVDGEPQSWELFEVDEQTGTGDDRFVRFELGLRSRHSAGPHALRLYAGNHPDEQTLFHWQVLVDDSAVIDASSLYEVEDGEVVRDRTGEWRGEEALRELLLSWRPRAATATRLYSLLRLPEPGVDEGWWSGSSVVVGASTGSAVGLPGLGGDELLPLVLGVLAALLGGAGLGLRLVGGRSREPRDT